MLPCMWKRRTLEINCDWRDQKRCVIGLATKEDTQGLRKINEGLQIFWRYAIRTAISFMYDLQYL